MVRPRGTDGARIIQVIETKSLRGLGTGKDPVREVTQYWDFEGNFLAETDVEHCTPCIEHDAKVVKESIVLASIDAASSVIRTTPIKYTVALINDLMYLEEKK